jgi:hypothetical protein
MCEYCSKRGLTVEKLAGDEQLPCEWISEESCPGACLEHAAYSVSNGFVEQHLCETHKRSTEKERDDGLLEFMESVGFDSQFEIRPITQEETCGCVMPAGTVWKACGKKAPYAKYILETSFLCAKHAADAERNAETT